MLSTRVANGLSPVGYQISTTRALPVYVNLLGVHLLPSDHGLVPRQQVNLSKNSKEKECSISMQMSGRGDAG